MKRLLVASLLALLLLVVGGLPLSAPSHVAAEDVLQSACKDNADDSATCQSRTDKNPLTGTSGIIYHISIIIASVAGVAAVIMIIISGLRYVTAAGDAQKITAAKNTLIGAIVGLVIIAAAQAIVTFVVRKL